MGRRDKDQLLDIEDAKVLFIAGYEENQARVHLRCDVIILLSAPAEMLAGRLVTQRGDPDGQAPGEIRRVVDGLRAVELPLHTAADDEIKTTMPFGDVVTRTRPAAARVSTLPPRAFRRDRDGTWGRSA